MIEYYRIMVLRRVPHRWTWSRGRHQRCQTRPMDPSTRSSNRSAGSLFSWTTAFVSSTKMHQQFSAQRYHYHSITIDFFFQNSNLMKWNTKRLSIVVLRFRGHSKISMWTYSLFNLLNVGPPFGLDEIIF